MKIHVVISALYFLILPAAFAANPEDLYTSTGTDPSPAELLANGSIVWGESFSTRTVVGSRVDVNNALLEQQTGVLGAFSSISGVHIPTSGRRTDYADITRWYQTDGNTQIFRLFRGENNYRYDIPAEAPPSRVESVSPTLAVASGTWRVWEGTYTIIDPFGSTMFQLFHEGSDLWSFHLGMSASGNISFNRRNSIAGLPDNITIAENMVGESLAIRVRANGFNYEVFKKIPLVDADWVLVTIGSYQQSPTNKVIFRWGMYPGSQPGTNSNDGLLFVSGARTSVSTDPGEPPPPPPATYYRDHNGADAGFGTAGGTWATPTPGDATQGWSAAATGATLPGAVTTTTADPVNFGTGTTGLGEGAIMVSGMVNSANMTFASGSGAITLDGGTINLSSSPTISVANTHTIHSMLGGATGTLTVVNSGTLSLYGANTFTAQLVIGNNASTTLKLRSTASLISTAAHLPWARQPLPRKVLFRLVRYPVVRP